MKYNLQDLMINLTVFTIFTFESRNSGDNSDAILRERPEINSGHLPADDDDSMLRCI